MVMKGRGKPGLSVVGAMLAMTMGMGGTVVAPIMACPPEKEKDQAKVATTNATLAIEQARAHAEAVKKAHSLAAEQHKAAVEQAGKLHAKLAEKWKAEVAQSLAGGEGASTFEQHMAAKAGGDDLAELLARLEKLESRLAQLEAERRLLMQGAAGGANTPRLRSSVGGITTPATPSAPAAPSAPRAPSAPGAPTRPASPAPPAPALPGLIGGARGGGLGAAPAPAAVAQDNTTITRVYRLPEGKLNALVELMAREDVPVMISHNGDGISVQGTAAQHRVFAAFVQLIHPEGNAGEAVVPVAPAAPAQGVQPALRRGMAPGQSPIATVNLARQADELEAKADGLEAAAEAVQAQAEAMEAQIEQMEDREEVLRDRIDEMEEQAEGQGGATREALHAQMVGLREQIRAIENRREALMAQVAQLEAKIDDLENRAEEARDQAEALRDQVDEEEVALGCEDCEGDCSCDESCEAECDEPCEPEAPAVPTGVETTTLSSAPVMNTAKP